jgi:hypothetical protein
MKFVLIIVASMVGKDGVAITQVPMETYDLCVQAKEQAKAMTWVEPLCLQVKP